MSDLIRFAEARRQSRGELHASWLDDATITIYDDPVPDTADTAITTQTALAIFVMPDPSGEVVDGVFTADVESIDSALILESGTASWARAVDESDVVIGDYDVGTISSGEAIEIDNLALVEGGYITVVSFVIDEG